MSQEDPVFLFFVMKRTVNSILKSILPTRLVRHTLGANAEDAVLLTFDDGPHPDITPMVLDLLDEYDGRAVFFIPGKRIQLAPNLLSEIIRRGHKIGNHSYLHLTGQDLSLREYMADILKCQDALCELTGVRPKLFRPPMGVITPSTFLVARSLGLQIMRWSLDTGEYNEKRSASPVELAEAFLANVKAGDIVLSHDDNDKVPAMLRLVLPELKRRGMDLRNAIDSVC